KFLDAAKKMQHPSLRGTSPMTLKFAVNFTRRSSSPRQRSFPFQISLSPCLPFSLSAVLAAGLTLAGWGAAPACAQLVQSEPGITVEGSGEARSTPDVIEINLKLTARAELTD